MLRRILCGSQDKNNKPSYYYRRECEELKDGWTELAIRPRLNLTTFWPHLPDTSFHQLTPVLGTSKHCKSCSIRSEYIEPRCLCTVTHQGWRKRGASRSHIENDSVICSTHEALFSLEKGLVRRTKTFGQQKHHQLSPRVLFNSVRHILINCIANQTG